MTNDTTSVERFCHLVSHKKIIKNKEGVLQSFFELHLNAYCTFKSYQKGLKPILAKRFYFIFYQWVTARIFIGEVWETNFSSFQYFWNKKFFQSCNLSQTSYRMLLPYIFNKWSHQLVSKKQSNLLKRIVTTTLICNKKN